MNKVTYFTEEGLKKLQAELNYLKTKGRAEIAKQIAEARDKGDLSENAEYDAAKEAQGLHELKISKLEESLSSARIIDENDISTDKVSILSKVKIENVKLNKLKFNPALASGPFITTTNDLMALAIYFIVAIAMGGI